MRKVTMKIVLCLLLCCFCAMAGAQTDASKSTAAGAGTSGSRVGYDALYTITSKDSSGVTRTSSSDVFDVQLSGPSSLRGATTDVGFGVHNGKYTPYVKGTYSGAFTLKGPAPSSNAIQFVSANSQSVRIDTIAQLKVNTFTTEAWIRTTSAASGTYFMGFNSGGYSAGMQFGFVRCGVLVGTGDLKLATTPALKGFNDDKWHHVSCSYDGSAIRTYVDGVLQVEAVASGAVYYSGATEFYVGQSITSATTYFDGKVDEVRIWSSVRSSSEIAASYGRKVSPTATGLLGYWQFDNTAVDSSSFGANGVLVNAPQYISDAPSLNCASYADVMGSPFTINIAADTSPLTGTGTRFSVPYQDAVVDLQAQGSTGNDQTAGGQQYKLKWTKLGSNPTTLTIPSTDLGNGKYTFPYNLTERAVFDGVATHEGPATNTAGVEFSGTTQYITVENSPIINVGSYTLEIWFKTTVDQTATLMRVAEPLGFYMRMLPGGKITCSASNVGFSVSATTPSGGLNDGSWHHAVCMVAPTSGIDNYLYTVVDGSAVANATLSSGSISYLPNLGTTIGGEVVDTGKYYNGQLDEIRLWSRPLTTTELVSSMRRKLSGTETGLIAYWPMDEGGGSITSDIVSGISGTLVGVTWITSGVKGFDLASPIVLEGSTLLMCNDYPTKPQYSTVTGSGLVGGDACLAAPIDLTAYNVRNETKICSFDNVTVQIQAPNQITASVIPREHYTGKYNVTYFPELAGTYTVDILVEGQRIPGSPFTATYVPGAPSATQSYAHGANLHRGKAGVQGELYIQARDGCKNNRTSDVGTWTSELRKDSMVVPLLLSYNGGGEYSAFYNLTASGVYSLNIKLDGQHVGESPYAFVQYPGDTVIGATWIYGSGLTYARAGEGGSFTIQARDSFLNNQTNANDNFAVAITGPSAIQTTISRYADGRHIAVYNATLVGTYSVAVTLDGVNVPGSPFTLTVIPGPTYPDHSVVTGAGKDTVTAGDSTSITITSWDRFNNQQIGSGDAWLVKMVGPQTYTLGTQPQDNGVYFVPYNITLAGSYSLQATLNGVHVAGSPFSVTIKPGPTSPAHVVVSASVATGVAGDVNTFTIQSRDKFSNNLLVPGDVYEVVFSGPKAVTPTIVYVSNGLQRVSYETTKNGDYTIAVRFNATTHVLGSPFANHVNAAALDPTRVLVTGSGTASTRIAGVIGTLDIISRDRFDNQRTETTTDLFVFKLDATRWPYATINAVSSSAGTGGSYIVMFNATVATDYTLTLKNNGVYVASSPFAVTVLPNVTHSAACVALGVPSRDGVAGELGVFFIQARDTFANNVTVPGDEFVVSITGPRSIVANLTHVAGGQYKVVYYEEKASILYTLAITRNGAHIQDSPIDFTIHPAPAYAPNSYMLPGTEFNYTMVAGEGYLHQWTVQGVDRFFNNRTSAGTNYVITMTPVGDGVLNYGIATYVGGTTGQYNQIQNTTKPGEYKLSITIDGIDLIGSPVPGTIKVLVAPAFGIGCLAYGGGQMWNEAGLLAEVFIQTRDKYENNRTTDDGSFLMTLTGPESRGPVNTTYRGHGVHYWSYNVTVTGAYTLSAVFNTDKLNVGGSPFPVIGAAAETVVSKSYVYGAGLNVGYAGLVNVFFVQAVDKYGNNATHVRSDVVTGTVTNTATSAQVSLTDSFINQIHTVGWTVTLPGTYSIVAYLNGIAVSPADQPWTAVIQPGPASGPKCTIDSSIGITGPLLVGQEGVITKIKSYDAHSNARGGTSDVFTVVVIGPTTVVGVVTPIGNGEYSASYNVTVEGSYKVNVMVHGGHVAASPYTVLVKPQATYTANCIAYGAGLDGAMAGSGDSVFYIQAKDAFGNNVTTITDQFAVRLSGPITLTPLAIPQGDGLYTVTYSTTTGGVYALSITLNGLHIAGSPRVLTVAPAGFSLAKSTVDSGTILYAGVNNVVEIQSRDVYGNKRFTNDASYTILLTGPQNIGPLTAVYTSNGVSTATLYITKLGAYTLRVYSGSTDILHSPLAVTGHSGPTDLAQSTLRNIVKSTAAGDYTSMDLQLEDSVGNNRTLPDTVVLAVTVGTSTYNVAATYKGYGLYRITTQTTIAGSYSMRLLVNGDTMPGTPITTTVIAGPRDPKNTRFYGPGMVGAEERASVLFYMQERDQYGNNVTTGGLTAWTIQLKNVANGVVGSSLTVTDLGGGVYSSSYVAGVKGDYQMMASVGGQVINNSPFTISVSPYVPRVIAAMFAVPSKLIFHVTYDEPTDRSQQTGSFACSTLLDAATVAKLGTSSWCTFRDDKTLGVFLGSASTIAASDAVVVKADKVKNKDKDSGFAAGKTVTLTLPTGLGTVKPVAVIRGPYVLADGNDLVLDGTTSYGGSITGYVWTSVSVTSTGGNPSIEAAFIASVDAKTTAQIAYPFNDALFDLGCNCDKTYVFRLTVTNNYGLTASTEITVIRKYNRIAPAVVIDGPSPRMIVVSEGVTLSSYFSTVDAAKTVAYTWVSTPALSGLTGTSGAVLSIPPSTLTAGVDYVFELRAAYTTLPTIYGSARVVLNAVSAPLQAVLSGGNRTATTNVVLDGSLSTPLNDAGLMYRWRCVSSTTTCPDLTSQVSAKYTQSMVVGKHLIELNVTKAGASSFAYSYINVVSTSVPVLSIARPYYRIAATESISFDVTSSVAVDAFIWTVADGDAVLTTASQSTTMSVAVLSSLHAGQTVTITVTGAVGSLVSTATAQIEVVVPPLGGSCSVASPVGSLQNGTFTLSCTGWVTDEDAQLVYGMGVQTGSYVPLIVPVVKPTVSGVYLPVGSPTAVQFKIMGYRGAATYITQSVNVLSLLTTGLSATDATTQLLDVQAANAADCTSLLQILTSALSLLNTAPDSATSTALRQRVLTYQTGCSTTSHGSPDDVGLGLYVLNLVSSKPAQLSSASVTSTVTLLKGRLALAATQGLDDGTQVAGTISNLLSTGVTTMAFSTDIQSAASSLHNALLFGHIAGQPSVSAMSWMFAIGGRRVMPASIGTAGVSLGPTTIALSSTMLSGTSTTGQAYLDVQVAVWGGDLYQWKNLGSLASNTTTITVKGTSGTVIPVVNGPVDAVKVTQLYTVMSSPGAKVPTCQFWDTTMGSWSSSGCSSAVATHTGAISGTTMGLSCMCSHTTNFVVRYAVPIVTPVPSCAVTGDTAMLYLSIVLLVLALIGIVCGILLDNAEAKYLPEKAYHALLLAKSRAVAACKWTLGGGFGPMFSATFRYQHTVYGVGPAQGVGVQFSRPERVVVALASLTTMGVVIMGFATTTGLFSNVDAQFGAAIVGAVTATCVGAVLAYMFQTLSPLSPAKVKPTEEQNSEAIAMSNLGPTGEAVKENEDAPTPGCCGCGGVPRHWWIVAAFYIIALTISGLAIAGTLVWGGCLSYSAGVEWLAWWAVALLFYLLVFEVLKVLLMSWVLYCRTPRIKSHVVEDEGEMPTLGGEPERVNELPEIAQTTTIELPVEGEEGGGQPEISPLMAATLESLHQNEYEEIDGVESTPMRKLPPIGARTGVAAVAGFTVEGEDDGPNGLVQRTPWEEDEQSEGEEDELAMARRFRQTAYGDMSEGEIVRYFSDATKKPEDEVDAIGDMEDDEEEKEEEVVEEKKEEEEKEKEHIGEVEV